MSIENKTNNPERIEMEKNIKDVEWQKNNIELTKDYYHDQISMIMGSGTNQSNLYKMICNLTPTRKKRVPDLEGPLQESLNTALTTFKGKLQQLRDLMQGLNHDEMQLIEAKVIADTATNYQQFADRNGLSEEQQNILKDAFGVAE